MKKKVVSFAVGAALAFSAAQVQSDELLFPYFKTGPGAWTFLSLQSSIGGLINTGNWSSGPLPLIPIDGRDFTANRVHYVWQYDDVVAGQCVHNDLFGSMSDFDLLQQTVNTPAFSGLDLPALWSDQSVAAYLDMDATEGFVIVANDDPEASFWGQAIIVDVADGTVTAYKGINDILQGGAGSVPATGNFSTLGLTTHLTHMYSWYADYTTRYDVPAANPLGVANTDWFVLATGTNMARTPNWDGRLRVEPVLGIVWNRDEAPNSQVRPFNVQCYDRINRTAFLNGPAQSWTANGGMYWALNRPRITSNNGTAPDAAAPGNQVGQDCFDAGIPFGGQVPSGTGSITCRATGALVTKIETSFEFGAPVTVISEENPWPNVR